MLLLTLEVIAIRRAWERFRSLGTLSTLLLMRTSHRERCWLTIMLTLLAWNSLVIGLVGPCWGEGEPDGVLQGRDLVIVLDMSRSMLASDAAVGTRFETAQSAALELVESLRTRGGHRVGVIIFAAKPMVWVPLTADYDHVSKKLLELDAAHVPLGIRPSEDSKSGTRFGAALLLAIKQHDERYQGFQHQ
jgi:Ca-activated chloride channel family protein